jgi:hypothetical protein
MGTTFVTLSHDSSTGDPGFWMRDGMLELWLRLLSLHLPGPTNAGGNAWWQPPLPCDRRGLLDGYDEPVRPIEAR